MSELTIHKTTDYDKFKFFESNRKVRTNKSLEKDIIENNKLSSHPILCTKDLFIVDGQHRFSICQKHGFEVHYVIDDSASECDIIRVQSAKKWNLEDYMHYWCVKGKPAYKVISSMCEMYKIPQSIFMFCFCGRSNSQNMKNFRAGTIEISTPLDKIDCILREYVSIRSVCRATLDKDIFPKQFESALIIAIEMILDFPSGNLESFKMKLRKNPFMLETAYYHRLTERAVQILRDIYNKGCYVHKL